MSPLQCSTDQQCASHTTAAEQVSALTQTTAQYNKKNCDCMSGTCAEHSEEISGNCNRKFLKKGDLPLSSIGTGTSISLYACSNDLVDLQLVANLTDASQCDRCTLAPLLTQEV
jgi:hypothetical protein